MSLIDDLSYDQQKLLEDRALLAQLREQRMLLDKQRREWTQARAQAATARERRAASARRTELGQALCRLDHHLGTLKRSVAERTAEFERREAENPDHARMATLLRSYQRMVKAWCSQGLVLTPHQQQVLDDTAIILGQKPLFQACPAVPEPRRIEPRLRDDIHFVMTGATPRE